jgi:L-malate glycosyltransferase
MPAPPHKRSPIEVLHIASGDRWAGAEAQLWTLVRYLNRREDTRARVVLLNEGETSERLREAGVAVDILDESRLNGFQILLGLRRLIRRHRPDVIHTHRQKENILGTLANLTTLRAHSVRSVHGAPEHAPSWLRPHKRLLAWLDWVTGRYLQDRIIAVSRDLGNQLGEVFSADQVVVIQNGVDIEAVRTQATGVAEFRIAQPDHRHIGLVGRLEPVKRADIFLRMAAQLTRESPPLSLAFHIFGDGSLRTELAREARALSMGDSVHFHGHRSDIPTCIENLDVLVICSDHEGLPMTALEAMALGTPVVAHRVGGLVDALEGMQGGVLVSGHTPQDYAHAVRNILQDCSMTSRLAKAGKAAVASRYSAAINAELTHTLYSELASETRAGQNQRRFGSR